MEAHLQAIVTILSLINPAVCAAIFAHGESGRTHRERFGDASKATLAVFVILVVSALVGTRILSVFGLSIDAFMVAGGVVLGWMGFTMLADEQPAPRAVEEGKAGFSALTPLIFFAASPGTITGVITIAAAHSVHEIPETALVAVAVGAFVLWLVLLASIQFGRRARGGGLTSQVVTRFMGLIVLAMGVQFGLQGFRSFMGTSG